MIETEAPPKAATTSSGASRHLPLKGKAIYVRSTHKCGNRENPRFPSKMSCYISGCYGCLPLNCAAAAGTPASITVSAAAAASSTTDLRIASSSFVKFDSTQSASS